MEEERIKSALELAMERISGLPQLTPRDIAEQKEKEFGPLGTALAAKYMNGALTGDELSVELSKHNAERRPIVRRALGLALCRELGLERPIANASKALRGMAQIAPDKGDSLKKIGLDFYRIIDEFEAATNARIIEFSALASRRLQDSGISGSAVKPNLKEFEGWIKQLDKMRREFEPEIERLREALMRAIS